MATSKNTGAATTQADKIKPNNVNLFGKENFLWMLIGAAVIAIGYFIMAGGKSANPKEFNDNEIYSTMRITVAPILIIAGFIIEIFAIMKKPKQNS